MAARSPDVPLTRQHLVTGTAPHSVTVRLRGVVSADFQLGQDGLWCVSTRGAVVGCTALPQLLHVGGDSPGAHGRWVPVPVLPKVDVPPGNGHQPVTAVVVVAASAPVTALELGLQAGVAHGTDSLLVARSQTVTVTSK